MTDLRIDGTHRSGAAEPDIGAIAEAIIQDLYADPEARSGRTSLVVGHATDRERFARELQLQVAANATLATSVFVYLKVPEGWTALTLIEQLLEASFQAGVVTGSDSRSVASFREPNFTLLIDDAHLLLDPPMDATDVTASLIEDLAFQHPWSTVLMGDQSVLRWREDARASGRMSSVHFMSKSTEGPHANAGMKGGGNPLPMVRRQP